MTDNTKKVLEDLRWRINDIHTMLLQQNHHGESVYWLDEWSTPVIHLKLTLDLIDKELQANNAELNNGSN